MIGKNYRNRGHVREDVWGKRCRSSLETSLFYLGRGFGLLSRHRFFYLGRGFGLLSRRRFFYRGRGFGILSRHRFFLFRTRFWSSLETSLFLSRTRLRSSPRRSFFFKAWGGLRLISERAARELKYRNPGDTSFGIVFPDGTPQPCPV